MDGHQPGCRSRLGGRAYLVLRTPGQGVAAYLASAPSADTDVVASVLLDAALTGGGTWISVVGRRVGPAEYRARIKVAADGAVTASLVRTAQGVETILVTPPVAVPAYVPGTALQVRMRLRGTAPTAVATKVWARGTAEPTAWLLRTTDATASLQSAGTTGLFTYLSGSADLSGNGVSVDDLDVRTPAVTVTTAAATTTRSAITAATPFTFASNTPGSTYSCSVDAAAWAPCTSPFSPPTLTDGVTGSRCAPWTAMASRRRSRRRPGCWTRLLPW